ncbi:hypothetical protein NMY22_g19254 [Coprinellus aureogranulatus]|nr:hypothetical protein NMY22_g19254 [Coprinellus aureogranulatus]
MVHSLSHSSLWVPGECTIERTGVSSSTSYPSFTLPRRLTDGNEEAFSPLLVLSSSASGRSIAWDRRQRHSKARWMEPGLQELGQLSIHIIIDLHIGPFHR